MGQHARLSPSGFKAHALCPGKYHFTKHNPSTTNVYAEQGTTAHELLEGWLKGTTSWETKLEFTGSNGTTIDADNIVHVRESYQYVADLMSTMNRSKLYCEMKVDPGYQWEGESVSSGTSDIVIIDPDNETLHVLDYKNGKGISVDVVESYQLMLYGLGVYRWVVANRPDVKITKLKLYILQPRGHHPDGEHRSWEISLLDIMRWDVKFKAVVEKSMGTGGELIAGEEQCRWCSGNATCPAIATKSLVAARASFKPITSNTCEDVKGNVLIEPEELTDEQLRAVMDSSVFIVGWLNAVKAYIEDRFEHKKPLEGYKMVHGRSGRKWIDSDDTVMKTKVLDIINLPHKHIETKKLKTPPQFEKTVKPLVTKEQWIELEKLIKKYPGKATLVQESDKRKAINLTAKETFKKIEQKTAAPDMSFLD